MAGDEKEQADGRADGPRERQDGVSRAPGEQRPSALSAEPPAAQHRRRQQRRGAEAGKQQRVVGEVDRAEDLRQERFRLAEEGADQPLVGLGVLTKSARRFVEGLAKDHRRLSIERVRNRRAGLDPAQPIVGKREPREVRRQDPERMRSGADIVVEPRQGELGGTGSTADRLGCLEHQHRCAVTRQLDRGRETVRAAPDDDGVQA